MVVDQEPQDVSWLGVKCKWWTLIVVGTGTFMSALDGSIVNTALPVIGRETRTPLPVLEWVVLVYLLTVISTLLVFGRLADIYGRKALYIAGFFAFVGGSALCGLSPGVIPLIGFRAVQALGAASLFALGPALLTQAFPPHERGRALGMQATMTYLGLSVGPALGGIITQHLGWRYIFLINLPLGAVVIPLALRSLRQEAKGTRQPFDIHGAVALAVSLASLMFALTHGQELGWSNPAIVATSAVAIVGLAVFIMTELRVGHPMLDLSLFANRTFAASTLAAFLNYTASSSVSFLMPFYLIQGSGYRVDIAGLMLISTSVVMAVTAMPAGWLSDRVGQRLPATIGMLITVAGLFSLRALHAKAEPMSVVLHLAIIGLGIGLFTSPNNSAIMGSAPRSRQGVAGALLAAARNLGFAMGVAFSGLIYQSRMSALAGYPLSESITTAMHDATTIVAVVALFGVLASALRGKVPLHTEE